MELRQLEIFRALAEELHFTRAAERVHCVQSNVTTQIQALEEELGTPLFDRLARRVVLTEAGRRLVPYAEKILASVAEAKRSVVHGSVPSGPLLVGAPESVLTYRLPAVLSGFRKLYPEVELIFRPHWDESLVQVLESGKLDMAIRMVDVLDDERVVSVRLRTERVLFVTNPLHPLTRQAEVFAEDLTGQTLLLTEAGCGYRKKLDTMLALKHIRPGSVTEFNSVEAIKECVRLKMGIGLLPEIVVAADVKRGHLVPLPWNGPTMDIATHILWHKDKWHSPAMDAFIQTVCDSLCEEAEDADEKLDNANDSARMQLMTGHR